MYGKGPNSSADKYYNEIYTHVDAAVVPPSVASCDRTKNGWIGSGTAALSTLPMVAPMLAEGPLAIGIAIGSLLAAAAGGFADHYAKNCDAGGADS
jgi:hypothetical protein